MEQEETALASLKAEAANENTVPSRLEELAHTPQLKPIIAANPAAPARLLERLARKKDPAIEQALAGNPNTPLHVLLELAESYPAEFLGNPIIPILNMTQPDFIWQASLNIWPSLLRRENVPTTWLQQLQRNLWNDKNKYYHAWNYFMGYGESGEQAIEGHVARAGEIYRPNQVYIKEALQDYMKAGRVPYLHGEPLSASTLILFVLLFPKAAETTHQEWQDTTSLSPEWQSLFTYSPIALPHKILTWRLDKTRPLDLGQAITGKLKPKILQHLVHYLPKAAGKASPQQGRREIVLKGIARNPRTSPQLLEELASSQAMEVRRAAAQHPQLTTEAIMVLALDEAAQVRAAIAARHHLTPEHYQQLATDSDQRVRAALARNSHTPQAILSGLAADAQAQVRAAAAGNPRLAPVAMAPLLIDLDESVRAPLAANAHIPADYYAQLAQDDALKVRQQLATNPRLPLALLEELFASEALEIWAGLARNPATPEHLLTRLAAGGNTQIQAAVAAHKHTPRETLEALATQKQRAVLLGLAANPHTPLHIIEQLIAREDIELWCRLFNHPAMLQTHRQAFYEHFVKKAGAQLTSTKHFWLRRALLRHRPLPEPMQKVFVNSILWEERYLLANHPQATSAILDLLTHDGNRHIRAKARNRKKKRRQA
ncbi:hypothetical protein EPA93_26845 [Ktedonosporobacter rubrisoli]|uniref:Leucine rich repeat variant domain-containing protein n=1 Tax=Ktedonosporobacter rubrisoli TaxID=2509675 RepID=A0A4P6JUT7_KTERU|nr:hypothetical protein [Ktedonosporobacter rubrisoli]QBD79409.1 hypothetical protein EPA93_26845 [Ktedonosporobacter rubrisoli]